MGFLNQSNRGRTSGWRAVQLPVTPEGDHEHVVVDFTGTFPGGQIGGVFDITFVGEKISYILADLI